MDDFGVLLKGFDVDAPAEVVAVSNILLYRNFDLITLNGLIFILTSELQINDK